MPGPFISATPSRRTGASGFLPLPTGKIPRSPIPPFPRCAIFSAAVRSLPSYNTRRRACPPALLGTKCAEEGHHPAPLPAKSGESVRRQLHRYPHRRPQPAHRADAERNVAAVRAGDFAGDGKAKARAAFILVARIVEP